ncbi:MAG: DUF2336 domain-containing protein [Pseudomonadota bacterium]|nr:DUF2336 domain-containing protein [Pseudomonadota bacterium]
MDNSNLAGAKGRALMGRLQHQLPTMFALAHEHSEDARVQLAGMLADVFLAEDAPLTLREEELVNELIDQLLKNHTPAIRTKLVNKFADVVRMPRRLALSLASDRIDIAERVLISSGSLTDDDLIGVVETQGHDHAKAIAQRSRISEAVADALVVTGDIAVMKLVAENLGAQLSVRSVAIVADAARFTADLREPIMKRPEMTAEAATRLFWWVSQDLRRYALRRFNIASAQVDEALSKTIDEFLNHYTLDRTNDAAMEQVADWLNERQAISERILPQVLRLGHYRLFNILLARLTGLNLSLIDTIATEAGGRGLAAVCRSIGVEKASFVSIFLLSRGARPGEQIVHPRELSQALLSFDRLTPSLAQDMLRSWKLDPSYFARNAD